MLPITEWLPNRLCVFLTPASRQIDVLACACQRRGGRVHAQEEQKTTVPQNRSAVAGSRSHEIRRVDIKFSSDRGELNLSPSGQVLRHEVISRHIVLRLDSVGLYPPDTYPLVRLSCWRFGSVRNPVRRKFRHS